MNFHYCIEVQEKPASSLCGSSSQSRDGQIKHVELHGTSPVELDHKPVEMTPLTDYLRSEPTEHTPSELTKLLGPTFHEQLVTATFKIPMTAGENTESILKRGIYFRQRGYLFLGHSDSQLKEKTCYLMDASNEKIHDLLAQFGDFLKIPSLRERATRIGTLFSPFTQTLEMTEGHYKMKSDIKVGKAFIFTDGCGFMSPEFSAEVQEALQLERCPSAVQVRFQGFQGMLVQRDDLTIKVQFHKSMQKYTISNEEMRKKLTKLDVVDYSQPQTNGYLDARMVMLLVDRGVSPEKFKVLQSRFFHMLENMCKGQSSAESFLELKGNTDLLQKIKSEGFLKSIKEELRCLRKHEVDEMEQASETHLAPSSQPVVRTRILVPQSRTVFGVCDPYKKLKYGECYFKPTLSNRDDNAFADQSEVLVARSPCHHPGDLRVLKLTHGKPGYENLKDCLVFPVKGPRPHAFECSGGNLGGDKFFVSWDDTLFPVRMVKPCDYSPTLAARFREALTKLWPNRPMNTGIRNKKKKKKKKAEYREEMIKFFATFQDDLPSSIDEIYMKFAAAFGPSSKECRKLSVLFHQAADLKIDRDALRKKLGKLQRKAAMSLQPSVDQFSANPPQTERTRLLVNDGEQVESRNPDGFFRRFFRRMRRARRPLCSGDAVWEKLDKKTQEFVDKVHRIPPKKMA